MVAPLIEGLALLGQVRVPVVPAPDRRVHVVQDPILDEPRDAEFAHNGRGGAPQVVTLPGAAGFFQGVVGVAKVADGAPACGGEPGW